MGFIIFYMKIFSYYERVLIPGLPPTPSPVSVDGPLSPLSCALLCL